METILPRLGEVVSPELLEKIKKYYDSGDIAKRDLADSNVYKLLRAYLQDCKYEHSIKNLETAELLLQTALENQREIGCDNWILKVLIEKFSEYRSLKEKYKVIDIKIEKDTISSTLKARGLWQI